MRWWASDCTTPHHAPRRSTPTLGRATSRRLSVWWEWRGFNVPRSGQTEPHVPGEPFRARRTGEGAAPTNQMQRPTHLTMEMSRSIPIDAFIPCPRAELTVVLVPLMHVFIETLGRVGFRGAPAGAAARSPSLACTWRSSTQVRLRIPSLPAPSVLDGPVTGIRRHAPTCSYFHRSLALPLSPLHALPLIPFIVTFQPISKPRTSSSLIMSAGSRC